MASKIDKLLAKLCPNGVEYKKLGEIATDIYRGSGILRTQVTVEGVPCVRYGEIYTTYGVWFDTCVSHTKLEYIQSPKYFEHGDILFAITGESVEEIAKSTAYVGNEKCLAGGDIVVLKHRQNPKYLAYALSTIEAQAQKSKGKVKSKVVHSSVPSIKEILIPVPPLEIQREVVEVLDKFALLTAELTAELEKRKKQYEHYRDKLLNFTNRGGYEQLTLGEICDVVTDFTAAGSFADIAKNVIYQKTQDYAQLVRTTDLKSNFTKSEKVYVNEAAFKYLWRVNLDCEGVVLPNVGNCGEVYYVAPDNLPYGHNVLGPNALWIRSSHCNIKYLSYWFMGEDFQRRLRKIVSPVGQSKFNKTELKKLPIPLPPLAEQERIVKILDRFDKLCNDLTSGLPAEIAARKKQYEYYRDKLLSFKRAG